MYWCIFWYPTFLWTSSFFFSLPLCSSCNIISFDLSSSLVFPHYASSDLLCSPSNEFFILVIVLFNLNFHLILFKSVLFIDTLYWMRQCQNTFLSSLSTVTFSSLSIFTVALLKSLLSLVPEFSQVQFFFFFLPAFFPCRGHTFLLLYVFHLFL